MTARRRGLPIVLAATLLGLVNVLPALGSPAGAVARHIVVFREGTADPLGLTSQLERGRGFRASLRFSLAGGFAARLSRAQVAALRADPRVAAVVEDLPVRAYEGGEPVQAGERVPAGVRRIEASAGGVVRGPSQANVAVLDSGIDLAHPDLNAVHGVNCVGAGQARDDNGHGSHVAGTIGARNNGSGVVGVAPGTRLVAVKVLDAKGDGTWSSVICGVEWVAATLSDADPTNDIRVANMSLGGVGQPVRSCAATTDPLHRAICAATAAGVTFVVAAGNDGRAFDNPDEPDLPAAYPQVLTVSAMSDSDGLPGAGGGAPACWPNERDDRAAAYSNYALTAAGAAHTIAAPGTCIRSTVPGGHAQMTGTSMAAPHVAGALALCLDANGSGGPCAGLTPAQIIARLRSDAEARAAASPGYGFAGDPLRPIGARHYGHLLHVGSAGATSVPVDPTGTPTIAARQPAASATGVAPASAVSVSFDMAMDRPSVEAAFALRQPSGSLVAGTFAWSADTLTFTPAVPLAETTTYRVQLSGAARSAAGVPLEAAEWTLRTLASGTRSASATLIESRSLRSGSYSRLAANDGVFFEVNSTRRRTYTTSWYARFASVPRDLLSLSVAYSGRNTRVCTQAIQLWDWSAGAWRQLDSRSVGRTKTSLAAVAPGELGRFVGAAGAAAGEVRVRVRCTTGVGRFYARADYMRLTFTRP